MGGLGLHSALGSSHLPFLYVSIMGRIFSTTETLMGLAQPGHSLGLQSASVVHWCAWLTRSNADSRSLPHSLASNFEQPSDVAAASPASKNDNPQCVRNELAMKSSVAGHLTGFPR